MLFISTYIGWISHITACKQPDFNDFDSHHDKYKVAESLDLIGPDSRETERKQICGYNRMISESTKGNMFQVPGNRCHFNSFNKDTTFWEASFLLPPNLAWPTETAFQTLASIHTVLTDLHRLSHPPHLSTCVIHPNFKFGLENRGRVELRHQPLQQRHLLIKAQTILFKAAL